MGKLKEESDLPSKQCTCTNQRVKQEFQMAGRPTYLKVDLDAMLNNLKLIRARIAQHTGRIMSPKNSDVVRMSLRVDYLNRVEIVHHGIDNEYGQNNLDSEIIAVVKGNAYGHGSVPVSTFLQKQGFKHFAVATALEGEELRQAGIEGFILVLGNASLEEIATMYNNNLTPTATTTQFLIEWLEYNNTQNRDNPCRQIVIKIDTGMSRNGCKPSELTDIVKVCDNNNIPIHSMMTHFAQAWDDPNFTRQQMDTFMETVKPYNGRGIKLHVSNSGAICNNVGVDLDFVRPGICMYGQPPDTSNHNVVLTESVGFRPAISWVARPTLIKRLEPGQKVGYDQTYVCKIAETIATIPVGYADGYHRNMFGQGFVTTSTGIKCPVVGRISMDSITVRLPDDLNDVSELYLMTSDVNNVNASLAIARIGKTIPYEVCTDLNKRVPRLYKTRGKLLTADNV